MKDFAKKINSAQDSKDFLTFLNDSDQLFHPEDNPREIIKNTTGLRLFTEEQCVNIENRLNEVFEYLDDPCEYILDNFDKF